MSQDDPAVVAEEYRDERGLAGRIASYRPEWLEGPDPTDIALAAVAEARPRRVLEVGCGLGTFAQRMREEHGLDVVAIDISPRMVELTRERGVDARVGDVQQLPFGDAEFDCAVANWMLYHVPDLDRGLAELARVLRPGGRLVATTNGRDALRQLRELIGVPKPDSPFSAETGGEALRRHFAQVEARDAKGWLTFPDRAAAQSYVDAAATLYGGRRELPPFDGPLRVQRDSRVFVATK